MTSREYTQIRDLYNAYKDQPSIWLTWETIEKFTGELSEKYRYFEDVCQYISNLSMRKFEDGFWIDIKDVKRLLDLYKSPTIPNLNKKVIAALKGES